MALIDRGALMFDYLQRLGTKDTYKAKYEALTDAVDNANAVDAIPVVHARWLDNGACGNCKCMSGRSETIIKQLDERSKMFDIAVHRTYLSSNFCPNCGARMDGDADD